MSEIALFLERHLYFRGCIIEMLSFLERCPDFRRVVIEGGGGGGGGGSLYTYVAIGLTRETE